MNSFKANWSFAEKSRRYRDYSLNYFECLFIKYFRRFFKSYDFCSSENEIQTRQNLFPMKVCENPLTIVLQMCFTFCSAMYVCLSCTEYWIKLTSKNPSKRLLWKHFFFNQSNKWSIISYKTSKPLPLWMQEHFTDQTKYYT